MATLGKCKRIVLRLTAILFFRVICVIYAKWLTFVSGCSDFSSRIERG